MLTNPPHPPFLLAAPTAPFFLVHSTFGHGGGARAATGTAVATRCISDNSCYTRCTRTISSRLYMGVVETGRDVTPPRLVYFGSRSQPPVKACHPSFFLPTITAAVICVSGLGGFRWHHMTRLILLFDIELSVSAWYRKTRHVLLSARRVLLPQLSAAESSGVRHKCQNYMQLSK